MDHLIFKNLLKNYINPLKYVELSHTQKTYKKKNVQAIFLKKHNYLNNQIKNLKNLKF